MAIERAGEELIAAAVPQLHELRPVCPDKRVDMIKLCENILLYFELSVLDSSCLWILRVGSGVSGA
jgi:hypothetical protein